MANVLNFRLAAPTDLPAVLELSQGVYGGDDYFLGEFINYLNDPNRKTLIAEKDGKAVGLQVIHIIDEGETVIAQSLRVHVEYRGQGIGKRLIQGCRDYVKVNFPEVKFERYSATSMAVERLGIQKKSDDVLVHKIALFACYVNSNAFELATRFARSTTEQCSNVKKLSKTEFTKSVLQQEKLERILFNKSIYIVHWQPFKALVSNIQNGLIEDGDSFFASLSGESVESLSHSRWCPIVKCPQLITVCYTLEKELHKAHIVKQLENAMLEHPGETFLFLCLVDTPLIDCTSELLLNEFSFINYVENSKPYLDFFFFEKSLV